VKPSETREHLARLEWTGKLAKFLPKYDPAMPWADVVSVLPYVFYAAIFVHLCRMVIAAAELQKAGGEPRPPTEHVLWLLLLVVLSQFARFGWALVRTKEETIGHRLRRKGRLLPTAIVQANQNYYDPDNEDPWPGVALVSFDAKALARPELLDEIAHDLARLKRADRSQLSPEHAAVSWWLFHEMGPIESMPIPPDLSRGLSECQMSCVTLAPGDYEHEGRLWVLALRKSRSPLAVATIPAEVLALPPVPWLKAFFWRWVVRFS
jgi:hypothetical protein